MIQMRQRPFGGISQDIWYFSFIICMWTVVQSQLLSLAVKADTVKGSEKITDCQHEIAGVEKLISQLHDITYEWEILGEDLGVQRSKINEIKLDKPKTELCYRTVLHTWYDSQELPCWEPIITVLKGMKMNRIASEIERCLLKGCDCKLVKCEPKATADDHSCEVVKHPGTLAEGKHSETTSDGNLIILGLLLVTVGTAAIVIYCYCKASKKHFLDSYAEYFRGRYSKEVPEFITRQWPHSYAEYLRGRYSKEVPEFITRQWPPPPTHKVFNLAIVEHKKCIQYGPIDEELVRLTLRGDVDDIIRNKASIELKDLFKRHNNKRKIILIEGAPGAGKSTLAWHICQKWNSGELFQEFEVVVFVQLRDPAIQSAKSLVDILPVESKERGEKVLSELCSCEGRNVLFVLDGWDEYGVGLQAHSPFKQLICSPEEVNVHSSSLVITSRPIASGKLQRYASSRVEIVGFTSGEVKKYFSESISDSKAEQTLQDYLRERPIIEASCYLPLNAAIVVHLFLVENHTLPHTLHEVFMSLVRCCIVRHLTRLTDEEEVPDISSLDDLPEGVQEPFNNICTMAYHGMMKNKATFSAADLQSFNLLPTEVKSLCLIKGVQSFTTTNTSVSWNFLHLSVQELLAALHISKLQLGERIQVFSHLLDLDQPQLAAVFRFYAAFTKLKTEGIRDIVARIVQKKQKPLLVNLLHGLYEAQDPSLCEFVASHLNGELDLSENTLGPLDCLVVGYFISCITTIEIEVNLHDCSLDEYRVRFLVEDLSKCSNSLKNVQKLDLSKNDLSDGGVVHICKILKHKNIKILNISRCDIGDQGLKSLASSLEVNASLEELSLSGNDAVTRVGLMALGESLKKNGGLKTLWLRQLLKGSRRPNTLWLMTSYNISNDDWEQFIVCLGNNHLTKVYLPSKCKVQQETIRNIDTIRKESNLPALEVKI